MLIVDSTISGNLAVVGGGVYLEGTISISGSTFSANTGGGAYLFGGNATVVNSTFSANIYQYSGSAIMAYGPVELVSSTIVGAGSQPTLLGGFTGGSITARGTIVDQPIHRASAGNIESQGHNISSDVSCGFDQVTDQPESVPHVRGLEHNGGTTSTQLLQVGSPAIDAIPSGTVGLCDGTVPTDQRGVARPAAGACDIGGRWRGPERRTHR